MYAALHPFCDVAAARSAETEKAAGHPQMVLATTILASSLAFIDGSVVNVGLSAVGRSLAADAAGLQWIINAYLLPLSALLLLGGTAGDRFGSRRLLVVGTTVFAFASLGCGFAPNLATLLAGRAIQGVGAAILLPNSLALLGQTFSGRAKGRAIGVWAAAGAAAGAIGPVLGGWLIDLGSWRFIFLINLPLAAGAVCSDQGRRVLQRGGWSGVVAIAAGYFCDIAADWQSCRPDRAATAAVHRVVRGRRWLPARAQDR